MMKYKIFRIRQKVSYHAFHKRMTICEIFLDSVKNTFDTFVYSGVIEMNREDMKTLDEFDKLLAGNITKCLNSIIRINYQKVLKKQGGLSCESLNKYM